MSRPLALTRAGLLAVAFPLFASRAYAHTALRRSEPAKSSTLAVAPTRIALWFTARPQIAFSRVRVFGPAGEVTLDRLVADTGNSMHAAIAGVLGDGEYRVEWQTASADGHPIRGEFVFTVATARPPVDGSPTVSPAPVSHDAHAVAPEAHAGHSEYRTARWLEFVALLTILGALAFRHGVLPPLASRGVPTSDAADRARRLGASVLVLYGVAAMVRLYTESVAVHGEQLALDADLLRAMLTTTTWGVGWMLGVVGAILVAIGWRVSKRSVMIGTPLTLLGAGGMIASPALSGHAAASEHYVWSVVFDMLHIAAAGAWIGGLLMILLAGIPAMRRLGDNPHPAIATLVHSFHPMALVCAPLVILAGLGTSLLRLGSFAALTTSDYGRMLLFKVALVLIVAGIGAYNSFRARHRLGDSAATRHIRMTMSVELLFAAVVLAVTTVLVTTPVPSELTIP